MHIIKMEIVPKVRGIYSSTDKMTGLKKNLNQTPWLTKEADAVSCFLQFNAKLVSRELLFET